MGQVFNYLRYVHEKAEKVASIFRMNISFRNKTIPFLSVLEAIQSISAVFNLVERT